MATLSENLVLLKTKQASLDDVKNLNLWGAELADVTLVAQMPNLEVLALSVNHVSTLSDIAKCSKLRELYLRKNDIADAGELQHLARLPKLATLWLGDNPVASTPNYRLTCIRLCPLLKQLDTVEITDVERAAATKTSQQPVSSQPVASPAPQPKREASPGAGGTPTNPSTPPLKPPTPSDASRRVPSAAGSETAGLQQPPPMGRPRVGSASDGAAARDPRADRAQRAMLSSIVALLGELTPNSLEMLRLEIETRIERNNSNQR